MKRLWLPPKFRPENEENNSDEDDDNYSHYHPLLIHPGKQVWDQKCKGRKNCKDEGMGPTAESFS